MARRRGADIPFPSREAILEFVEQNPDRVSRREIARAFNLDADRRPELRKLLAEMIDEGLIDRSRGRTVAARGDLPAVSVIEITGTDEDGDVRGVSAAGAHSGECLVARRVQERNPPVIVLDLVGADVLRDTTTLAAGHILVADGVQ